MTEELLRCRESQIKYRPLKRKATVRKNEEKERGRGRGREKKRERRGKRRRGR